MTRVFAEEDIEEIIRAFPPLSLAGDKPTLVKSLFTGDGLADFASALARFESILEREEALIEISHIHSILGIERDAEQHILDQCSLQLYFSKDGRSLISVPLADVIHQELAELALTSFVDLGAFAARQDIALGSIERWIKFDAGSTWQTFVVEDKRFLCNQLLRDNIESRIRQGINEAGSDVCNVSASFDDEIQTPILQFLVESIMKGQGGEVILDGGHVIYVPSEYSAAAEERYRQAQLDRVHLMATEIEDSRFSLVQLRIPTEDEPASGAALDLDGLEKAVRAKFEEWHPECTQLRSVTCLPEPADRIRKLAHGSHARLLVDAGILQHELGRLKAAALLVVEDNWSKDDSYPDPAAIVQSLRGAPVSGRPGLAQFLLRSECVIELEEAVKERIEELQKNEQRKLVQLLEARVLVPLQLYTTGINTVVDPALRQHLEEFTFDRFRREVVPQSIKSAQELSLLREKTSQREVEKLRQAATVDARTLPTLQASVTRFTRKMKIAPASDDVVETVRMRTLQQSVKAMRSMTRGSDLLQNLIWIELAQRSGGLYMSSGKDTSRMIKQYAAVGDAEMAARLGQWRNLLKAGQESKEDLQMMRDAARLAVEEMAAG